MPHSPTVSVITATYNRSRALRLAVQTVQWQTLSDWRLHVIGDACTDDTAEVMGTFDDPRIDFENLPHNVGEQSGPNNVGLQKATGRYLAFLNHDDLWLPDHLSTAVQALEETGADLALLMFDTILRDGTNRLSVVGEYDIQVGHPASTWVFRRELIQSVGLWRPGARIWGSPSQDWLFRASRQGVRILTVPYLTVVLLPSSSTPDGYTKNNATLGEACFARIQREPDFRAREIAVGLGRRAADRAQGVRFRHRWWRCNSWSGLLANLGEACRNAAVHLARRCGPWFHLHPEGAECALRHPGRGGMFRHLRKLRGLPPRAESLR